MKGEEVQDYVTAQRGRANFEGELGAEQVMDVPREAHVISVLDSIGRARRVHRHRDIP